jgi:DNA-binding ferritin-like protein
MKCADFIGLFFLARDVTHSVHLNTRSYAKHKALQKFYEGIIERTDDLAEAYQGRYGLLGPITLHSAKTTSNVVDFLQEQLDEIEAARYDVIPKTDTALHNLVDNIIELYLSTLYKLRFLS